MTILLYNPLSKNKKSKRATKKLVDYYKKNNLPFKIKSLLKIKDLEDYLKNTPENINIILLGGDGTINAFINNSIKIPLKHHIRIKPTGSGNDFLRTLKRLRPNYQYIMKLKINDKTNYFINGSGMGIDGLIAQQVNQKIKKNNFNYLTSALKAFTYYKPVPMEVTLDNKVYNFKKTYLINANNAQFIGGGMRVTPKGDPEKNELDVIVVHGIPKAFLFVIFLSVYLGIHTIFKRYVFTAKATHVKATVHSAQIAQCDGETFDNVKDFEVSLTNKKARFKAY